MITSQMKDRIKKLPFYYYFLKPIRFLLDKPYGLWLMRLSKRKVNHYLKTRGVICLEIGAGNVKGENEWITLDLSSNADIYWDLNRGLPFPSESIQKIYSSHVFEHFTFKEADCLLDECLRVLIPGGVFSVCVPNAKLYIRAYMESTHLDAGEFLTYCPAYAGVSIIDYINYIAYMDGQHKYMFDEENLVSILKNKGFKNAYLRGFDASLDLEIRKSESIYAEALK